MRAAYIVGLFASAISYVAAQSSVPFYITNPIQGTVFVAGQSETITWSNGIDEDATVTLLTGTSSLSMKPTGITFTIKGADEEMDWIVPKDLPQNATFALQITYSANGTTETVYSSPFSITGTTGPLVTGAFVTGSPIVTAASSAIPTAIATPSPIKATISAVAATTSAAKPTASTTTTSAANNFKVPSTLIAFGITFIVSNVLF